jgi:energy-coupling factor transporter transmembrane protein EcfT
VSPLPVGLLCGALLVGSVAIGNPLGVAACAVAATALLWAAPPPRSAYAWFAGPTAALVFVVNPFVGVQGLTPLWSGPHIPLLDTEVTQEELVFGLAAALRIIGSSFAIAAFVRLADGDRVLAAAARVAPRSAMIAGLGSRLLPTLERDAEGLVLAARARAAGLHRRRQAAALAAPLVSLSLERSMTLAEAMEARGYGGGLRTRPPRPAMTARERLLLVLAAAMSVAVAVAVRTGGYRYYDLLGDPFTAAAIGSSAVLLALSAAAAGTVRWRR